MKFFIPFVLLAATAVTAQDPDCEANYIVDTCLGSEMKKLEACTALDYECMCAASEAISTCFNNCPKDTRGATYRSQVTVNCQNASLYGTAARHAATATDKTTTATRTPSATTADATDSPTTTGGQSATGTFVQNTDETGSPNVGVAQLARHTGGLLLAVAGVVAAVL
ncbi:hypothetical protein HYQ45_012011 [Verticillium longisporum]|uniref:Extracellular membrane protein CFEM domain-containing protein n=1 Tax=Verticillium longisporum TaxID=100787 RepID=A0A8I2ZFA3_VERLO|nr:hypothetical protein HYQ44_004199 [Verticillium longisporum]KAG7128280.1 hypothetical protein HYQ45_012011 [Verticillium longisporum]PNH67069.1 hypothetical protein VD0001_g7943 [Verticillium dahliae]RBQ94870.1 hypothetical protein VDGD_00076 [Verticillium dahliae]